MGIPNLLMQVDDPTKTVGRPQSAGAAGGSERTSAAAAPERRDGAPRCLVVTASQWPTHAGLPRLLYDAGFEVTSLGTRRSVGGSRYVHTHVPASSDPGEVTDRLREHLRESPARYARIVVCNEDVLRLAAERFTVEELAAWYPVPLERASVVTSKEAFLSVAARENVPMPATVACATRDAARAAAQSLGFPVVAKPLHGHGGSAIVRLDSDEDIDAIDDAAWPLLFQRLLIGTPGTVEALFVRGEPVRWFVSEMLDCFPAPFGPSSARRVIDMPQLEPILRAIGRATGFDGIGGVDWFFDRRSGRIQVLELNARPQTGYDLLPETHTAFALALGQIAKGKRVAPSGAISVMTTETVAQYPQHLYFALFQPGLRLRARAERTLAAVRRLDRTDLSVARAHAADLAHWIYGASPLAPLARRAKQSEFGQSLRARLRG